MNISIVTKDGKEIVPGNEVPSSLIISEIPHTDELVLVPGELNPKGEEVLISGNDYSINKKYYDLSSGYAIRAVIREDKIVPKLRPSRMAEKQSQMKTVYSPRCIPHKEGELVNTWPIVIEITKKEVL